VADGWSSRLKRFFRRDSWDTERAREIQSYLDTEAAENIARGMSEEDAWFAARRKFGNPIFVREEIYKMNSLGFLEELWSDLRYGIRLLRLNPGFATAAILSLALGIGANTAIFQLLDAVRLRTLPVRDPQGLALIKVDHPHNRTGDFVTRWPTMTYPQFEEIQKVQQGFSAVATWAPESMNLARGGEVHNAQGLWVSGGFFGMLGVQPLMGRLFRESDDYTGCGASSAVVSYSFWQREYGGAADAIGRQLYVDGHSFQIVGVTPPAFYGAEIGRQYDIALPNCAEPLIHGEEAFLTKRSTWWLVIVGRLKPGWSVEKAAAQLRAVSPQVFVATLPSTFSPDDAKTYLGFNLVALPGATGLSDLRDSYENPLWLLLGLAGLVLLIACFNLANLMLARASAREKEIAVRLAIGASRGRLVRQLLAESLLLALAGTALGTLLAKWISGSLVAFLSTPRTPVFVNLGMDWRVLGFAAALAVMTCVLFGLAPALRGTRVPPGAVLKAVGRGNTPSRERFGLRRTLVVAQVALSLVLLIGALLFARSLRNLMTMNTGMNQSGILVADVDFTRAGIPKERRATYQLDVLQRVRAIPGVSSAALAYFPPLSDFGWCQGIVLEHAAATSPKEGLSSCRNTVSQDYFKTMGIPILAGRDFNDHDTLDSPRVAVVTQTFANKFFPGENPLGKTFRFKEPIGRERSLMQIVGVVSDSKYQDLREAFQSVAYTPSTQNEHVDPDATVMIRAGVPMREITSAIQAQFSGTPSDIEFTVLRDTVEASILGDRLMALLSGFFGLLAELLATIGLYGVMSYMVVRRRNEIGIRTALGANRSQLIFMILREAGVLMLIGLVIGTALAIAGSQTAASLLYGLKPTDPSVIAAAIGILTVVAIIASYVPALRASRVDPMLALRDE
jgi:putative ABC transport system permease protein